MTTNLAGAAASCTGTWTQKWNCGWKTSPGVAQAGYDFGHSLLPALAVLLVVILSWSPSRGSGGRVLGAGRGRGPAMTEAARRQLAKPPQAAAGQRSVLWAGLALGTFLAVEALTHGVMLPCSAVSRTPSSPSFSSCSRRGPGGTDPAASPHRRPARGPPRQARRVCGLQGHPQARRPGSCVRRRQGEGAVGRLASPAGSAGRGGRSATALRGMGRARCPRAPFTGSSITQLNRR